MQTRPGTYTLGPENGTLTVRTGRSGAAAKAGHNLLIEVTSWRATLELGAEAAQSRVVLTADSGSLAVREGTGGVQALDEDDKAGIKQTIDDEILKGAAIEFRSSEIATDPSGDGLTVRGELKLIDRTHPLTFDLAIDADNRLTGTATVKQSDWGIKPYSGLFGTLKVTDALKVTVEATLTD